MHQSVGKSYAKNYAKSYAKKAGMVTKWRYGQFSYGQFNSRVVLDLKGPAAIKYKSLWPPVEGKGYRLVVDLATPIISGMLESREKAPVTTQSERVKELKAVRFPLPSRKPDLISKSKPIIVIDPGHGGIDPGATSSSGVLEKNIVLATAKVIKSAFKRTGRYKVYLTREKDQFVRLRKRFEIAQRRNADVFLSLHADSIKSRKIGGMSVYTLSKKGIYFIIEFLLTPNLLTFSSNLFLLGNI